LKIHVLFFEIRRTEDKFAMGGHVTWNVLKTTRTETINTLSGWLIRSFFLKVTCSSVDAQVTLVFPSLSGHGSIRACYTKFLQIRWVVLLHLYSSYFPFIKQQDLMWVLEYQRWFVTSSHLVGNLCVALGLSIFPRAFDKMIITLVNTINKHAV